MTQTIDTQLSTNTLRQLSQTVPQLQDKEVASKIESTNPQDLAAIASQVAQSVQEDPIAKTSTSPPTITPPTTQDIQAANAAAANAAQTGDDFISTAGQDHSGNTLGYIMQLILETGVETMTAMNDITNKLGMLTLTTAATTADLQLKQADLQKQASDAQAYAQIATGITTAIGGGFEAAGGIAGVKTGSENMGVIGRGIGQASSGVGSALSGGMSLGAAEDQYKADKKGSEVTKAQAFQNYISGLQSTASSNMQTIVSTLNSNIATFGAAENTVAQSTRNPA